MIKLLKKAIFDFQPQKLPEIPPPMTENPNENPGGLRKNQKGGNFKKGEVNFKRGGGFRPPRTLCDYV